jgi:hypothetical protein
VVGICRVIQRKASAMRIPLSLALVLIATASILACSTQLTDEGSKVDPVTAASADHCDLLKIFTVQGADPDETLRIAFNEAAKLGGNTMAIAGGRKIPTGSEITVAVLSCRRQ